MPQNLLPTKQNKLDVQIKCANILEAVVIRAEITESISNLFKADVFLQTTKQIDTERLLSSTATISFAIDNKNKRFFSGIIEEASFENVVTIAEKRTDSILYIKIVPTFARTTYSKKYRSFQDQTAKDIIQNVLKENNITNSKINLRTAGNAKRTFCVQYGESDFHFISRLMEEEGIFYYFEQSDGKDTLQLSDLSSSCTKIKTELKIRKVSTNSTLSPDSVYNVSFSDTIGTKKIDAFSYNELKAEVISGTSSDSSDKTRLAEKEIYDPLFIEKNDGNDVTKTILEGENSFSKRLTGNSYCPDLFAGSIFKISGSKTEKHNGEFLAVSIKHYINQLPEEIDTPIYHNSFVAIPSKVSFRPLQTHFKNRIFGCQTAVVTGTSGEEIFCDENARIKVKFHWDSRVQPDEKSSCWIRIAQTWAGNNFGALIIPRVGMEVLVQFVNGDPDQPIVVGCLYNGVNKNPNNYAKEVNTVSTFKTNTSKGEGYNELSFNDKEKEEEIFIHAQKDMNSIIENSVSETLNEGSKKIILESQKDPVEHSLLIKKGKNTITINEGDYIIALDKGNQTITLKEGNQTITLSKGNLNVDVKGSISIKASKDINIESQGAINIKSMKDASIDSKAAVSIKAAKDFSVDSLNFTGKAKMAMNLEAMNLKADIKAAAQLDALSITVNSKTTINMTATAAMTLTANAAMTITGTGALNLSSGGAASVHAGAVLALGGASITLG